MFSEKLYATFPPGADRPLSPGGRLVCWAGVLLAALIYALFSLHVPYIGDDYALPVDWMTANGGVKEFSWPRMWNFTAYLRSIDNCRLDNIVFMAMRMALLPKWTLALVVGLSGAFLILGAGQLCSPRRSDLPLVMIAFWGWMTFTFSWPFGTMGIDNSFNVLLPSAMTVWFLVLLRRVASGRLPVPVLVAGGVYAFLCGWIHEGYAVPVGCGLGTWALLRRFRMPWQWWILTAVFAAGALWVVSAPGLWMRFSSVSVGAPVNLKTVLTLSLPVVVLAGLAVVLMACRIRKCALGGCRDHYWAAAAATEASRAQRQAEAQEQKSEANQVTIDAARTTAASSAGSEMGKAVINYATQFVGNPYVYGGSSLTNGTDCSGFVMSVYSNFGVSLPHSSSALRSKGYDVGGLENAQPGDIVCYSGHVGLYVGNGQIVHASTSRTGIIVSSATYRNILTVRRIF